MKYPDLIVLMGPKKARIVYPGEYTILEALHGAFNGKRVPKGWCYVRLPAQTWHLQEQMAPAPNRGRRPLRPQEERPSLRARIPKSHGRHPV